MTLAAPRQELPQERWLVAGLVLLALALRCYQLGLTSLWADEAFSAWMAGQPAGLLWLLVRTYDTHPPLYYLLLQGWTALFGDGEAALRAPSALLGAATVPLVYAAGAALAPAGSDRRWLGGIAALLFALAPFQLAYAQEARSYAALVAATALALLGGVRLLCEPVLLRRPGWPWALLVAGWALGLWLHNLAALMLASFLPPLVWCCWRQGWAACRNLAGALLLAFLLWSPELPTLLAQLGQVRGDFWLAAPDAATIARTASKLLTLDRLGSRNPWPLLAALQLWGLVWLAREGRGAAAALLLAVAGLGFLGALVASYALVPVFLDRTLIWTALPGYLALAAGLCGLPGRLARPALTLLVLAAFAWGALVYHDRKAKEPWRDVVGRIVAGWQAGDAIAVAPPYGAKAVGYYRRRAGLAGEVLVPRWEDPSEGQDQETFARLLEGAGRVWLVTRAEDRFAPAGYWVTQALDGTRPRLQQWAFDDRLGLVLFGPAPQAPVKGDAP